MTQPAGRTTLLLTRPFAASQEFAKNFINCAAIDRVVISPLMEIVHRDLDVDPAQFRTVVFTSKAGVEAWRRAGLPVDMMCRCVGEATLNAARAIGFEATASGGTVAHLEADLIAAREAGPILHVRGVHSTGNLVENLSKAGLEAQSCIAYDQPLRDLSREARDVLRATAEGATDGTADRVIVPLFSPRTAAHFKKQCSGVVKPFVIAISKAAAVHWPDAQIAPSPSSEGMVCAVLTRLNPPAVP
jgi:uroporphyrinogen-III synthase